MKPERHAEVVSLLLRARSRTPESEQIKQKLLEIRQNLLSAAPQNKFVSYNIK